ncbi:hypothetical protein DPMN_050839 [Dreissena polymorpha]|uniref:Uncharacterized protein n=1 Tax=Dreissena polymorpha TaxID=45954 RepID=A0A9D4CHZ7_DREPO|nr:hypothetical protein DPMN_050839 [Dreissena polymorpha]
MEDALKNIGNEITEAIIKAGYGQLASIKRKGDEVLNELDNAATAVKAIITNKTANTDKCEHQGLTGEETTSPMNSKLSKIQAWLIDEYQTMGVAPVSMLHTDIDVPLERIYVAPSIRELKRGQKNRNSGHDLFHTSLTGTDVSSYNELLCREGKPVNTIYI